MHTAKIKIYLAYVCEFDDLSAAQTELLVVIQHSVHVLNPHGVHGSVKHVPALVLVRGG